jgi:hypothetical protein
MPVLMQVKREVAESHRAWREAARELDQAIGIELDPDAADRSKVQQVMDIRRFRRAVKAEREARTRYVTALRADHKPVPEELVWDISEGGHAGDVS